MTKVTSPRTAILMEKYTRKNKTAAAGILAGIITTAVLLCLTPALKAYAETADESPVLPMTFSDLTYNQRISEAERLMESREYAQALEILTEIKENPDASPAYNSCIEQMDAVYNNATEMFYSRDFEGARALLEELGDYRDSAELEEYILFYEENEPEFSYELISGSKAARQCRGGTVYHSDYWGQFYVPDEVTADTKFLVFYSDGTGFDQSEDNLDYDGMYSYLDGYCPDAVMFFTSRSGYNDMYSASYELFVLLSEIARESGTVIHDLSLAGDGSGGCTALYAAAMYSKSGWITPANVLTFDMGLSGTYTADTLSVEDIRRLADTDIYIFERENVSYDDTETMTAMLEAGINAEIITCSEQMSDDTAADALRLGVLSWATGESDMLPEDAYMILTALPGL